MVTEIGSKLKNPLVLSALVLIVLLYSGFLSVRGQDELRCLINPSEIVSIKCHVIDSPVKSSSGSYYKSLAEVSSVYGKIKGIDVYSPASGNIKVLIPCDLFESYMPQKLSHGYLDNDSKCILEKGIECFFVGKWSTNVDSFIIDDIVTSEYADSLLGKLWKTRAEVRNLCRRIFTNWGEAGNLMLALLTGNREYLDGDIYTFFREAGCAHVLALSGMHLSFVTLMAVFLLSKVTGARTCRVITFTLVTAFVFIANESPSLTRSYLFVLVLFFLGIVGISRPDRLYVLAGVFIMHIILFPSDANSIGFKLSYMAVAGLFLISPHIEGYVTKFFAGSLGTFVSTIPVNIIEFGCVYPVGIVASLFVGPLVAFFMILGAVGFIFSFCIPFLLSPFSYIMSGVYNFILAFISFVSKVSPIYFK